MGYYQYLCGLLSPLGVYQLSPNSISGAELMAAGTCLDNMESQIAHTEQEGIVLTAQEEGLSLRERILPRCPVYVNQTLRREALMSLLRISNDGFYLNAINQTLNGCGIHATAWETDSYGTICICFPDVAGEPDNFEQIKNVIMDIVPCHLAVEFVLRFLTWEECETIGYTWEIVEQNGYTWETFSKAFQQGE